MNIKKIINHHSRNKLLAIITSVILLVAAGSLLYWFFVASKPATTSNTNNATTDSSVPKDNRTHTSTTDGQTITVPNNVDPSSIKNYTLITDNEEFKIRTLDGQYYITLYAIINRPDQAASYKDQLKQFKQDALTYLTEHNVDISKIQINYDPAEAANL